jgi:hypothetical protein
MPTGFKTREAMENIEILKVNFNEIIKLRDSAYSCSLESKNPDIYEITAKTLILFEKCIPDIRKFDADINLSNYDRGLVVIGQCQYEDLETLKKHKKKIDRNNTFKGVKKNLLYYLDEAIRDLDEVIKKHKVV